MGICECGHWGGDNRVGEFDQYVALHFFKINVLKTSPRIELTRDFDKTRSR
jgi:hypothetical protein